MNDDLINVLLLEDNPSDAELIRQLLPPVRYSIQTVSRLQEALALIQKDEFGIALIDLNVPDSFGLETIEAFVPYIPKTPIVVMTGYGLSNEIAIQALKLGAEDYVVKGTFDQESISKSLDYAIERHKVAQLMREEKSRYQLLSNQFQTLFDNISDGLILLSDDYKVLWANPGAEKTFKTDIDNIVGKTCYEVLHNRLSPCEDCLAKRCKESGHVEIDQKEVFDGRVLSLKAFPIKNEQGEVERIIEFATDITDKIKSQAESVRTAHLAAIGELAAGIAHEINNPVCAIMNLAQLISMRSQEDTAVSDYSRRIIGEGERVALIVSKLLSFARKEGDEKNYVLIKDVVYDTLPLIEKQLVLDSIDLQINIPDDLPLIVARKNEIQQVFLNMLSNSKYALNQKFSEPSPEKIIKIDCQVHSDEYVRTVFYDQGIGIPQSIIEKTFEPFFTTKPVNEGTGLGLSISFGIIKEHNGRFDIESDEGVYTKITVDLPIAKKS